MNKRGVIVVLSILVLTMFLTYDISYANVDIDKFASEQLQYYIEGYKTNFQEYGFSSQSEMENSKLGKPVQLYQINRVAIENYTDGDLPLADSQSWLYPIYGENKQVKSAIQISIGDDGKPYSIFGGFTADVLSEFFQDNLTLLNQKDNSALKAVLQEDISSLFIIYKKDDKEKIVPYLITQKMKNVIQNKKTYNSYEIGQIYKEKLLKDKEYYEKNFKPGEELTGGVVVNPLTRVKLFVLMLVIVGIASTITFYLIKRRKVVN